MRDRALTICLLFLIATMPGDPAKITVFAGGLFALKISDLIQKTRYLRRNGSRIHYVMSPGQAIVDVTAQVLRHLAFAIEFLLAVIYGRLLAFMCDTAAQRNTLAFYTLVSVFLHSWEYIISEIYSKSASRTMNRS